MDETPFKTYITQIEQAFKAGNATEHTHRPALKTLLESLEPGITAVNEPKRIQCGAPDYIITRTDIPLGFIEAKDIGIPLDDTETSEQLLRYRESLANLVLTDYLEFRWYVAGEWRLTARLARPQGQGRLRKESGGAQRVSQLLHAFLTQDIPVIASPRELAVRMAALARLIRSIIDKTLREEGEEGALHEQMTGFRQVLLADLTVDTFADMYAQTICYGLFAARCNHTGAGFSRAHAAYELPKTNPFLRKLFGHIAGPDLDDRIAWAVDDLAALLGKADMVAILTDFGHATRQEDPVVHFYETFLAAYDSKMREKRGVYYTPEPVVSYIVRSVDAILQGDFRLCDGLADSSRIKAKLPAKYKKQIGNNDPVHRVQILDPAAGTGTFLYEVIRLIHERFAGNQGLWSGYVRDNLLPRLYGFELLMAPYAVAHMKLGLLLRDSGYDFSGDERLRVFLTNTLEEAHALTGLPLFTQWLAEEANSANRVKKDAPVMVILGNPPYSGHSANTGQWIADLLRGMDHSTGQKTGNYFAVDGQPLGERNPKWLNDDYVKFIRFAQWRIEQTGYGVLAFVTNHGYLDNPTFRGMRQSLMESFDALYLLDLHGNSKKKEQAPDGGKDENVFDIQQGVAIGIFVKRGPTHCTPEVYHADLYGTRLTKYAQLTELDITSTSWRSIQPHAPFYLFAPQDETLHAEYEAGWKITDIFPKTLLGPNSHRDDFAIAFSEDVAKERIADLANRSLTDDGLREKYNLHDNRDWKLSEARRFDFIKEKPIKCIYRPFDFRWMLYGRYAFDYPRPEVNEHLLQPNKTLITTRQTKENFSVLVCNLPAGQHKLATPYDGSYMSPLYIYPTSEDDLFTANTAHTRRPNLVPAFVAALATRLQLTFTPDGRGDLVGTFGPEDIFHYAYAIFHAPTYRSRYAEFLKIDFPRLPLTSDQALFRQLCSLGEELVALHLMARLPPLESRYPVAGDNRVEIVRYSAPSDATPGRVWINDTQYFEGVATEVWEYHLGGYQVCHKWLKDRRRKQLSYDDLTHYRSIIAALSRTIGLQAGIDDAIGVWPLH